MVFFNDQAVPAADDSSDDEAIEDASAIASPSVTHSSCAFPTQGLPQLVVDVHRVGNLPSRVDISMSHSITPSEPGLRNPLPVPIPVRTVSSLCSLFDLAGSSGCTSTYVHGRELGGKSSVIALQVPASSLPPPLSATAMVDSYQISSSTAFFPHFQGSEQRLLDAGPSTRESMPCMPCEAVQVQDVVSSGRADESTISECPSARAPSSQGEIVRRLTEVLQGRVVEDAILQPAERDNMIVQFLQALDVQVVGACRADERLRPMLRWNMSCTGADGRLLEHLSQHFKARELGMLARCLCAPLVTIRVGRVQRQGRFLCPTGARGYLSLSMLPCSDLRISFVGDNGAIERIAAVKSSNDEACISLETLHQDPSGRSFVVKLSGGAHVYFWQSEKSKIVGDEMISEMRDILAQRPTLSKLTGVHESRLDSFVSQIRGVLCASSSSSSSSSSLGSSTPFLSSGPANSNDTSSSSPSSIRQSQRLLGSRSFVRLASSQPCVHGRAHGSTQGTLSPRGSGFKEGSSKGMPSSRGLISSREKHRRRGDSSNSLTASSFCNAHWTSNVRATNLDCGMGSCESTSSTHTPFRLSDDEKVRLLGGTTETNASLHPAASVLMDGSGLPKQLFSVPLASSSFPSPPSLFPSILGGSYNQSVLLPPIASQLITTSSILAPYSCPCPLRSSSLQYAMTPPFFSSASEVCTLPSSSSLFSVKQSSAFLSQTTLSLDRVSISPISLPVSSLVNIPTPLQTSSLPPFFSDPIVHIPVIDFQSANQSFLVSAPPSISSAGSPPVLPSFLSSILSGGERLTDEQESATINFYQNSGASPFLRDDHPRDGNDLQPLVIESRFRALLSSCTEERKNGEQETNPGWHGRLDSSRSSIFDALPQYSGPLLGMVPAIITSGSLSCVLNFCQERSAHASTWVTGSRGLYGMSCDPAISLSTIGSCSASSEASLRKREVCSTTMEKNVITDDNCSTNQIESTSENDDGTQVYKPSKDV